MRCLNVSHILTIVYNNVRSTSKARQQRLHRKVSIADLEVLSLT